MRTFLPGALVDVLVGVNAVGGPGGAFTRRADVVFHPGLERLSITQQFEGVDAHHQLVVNTELEGRLPAVPPGSSVLVGPYQEIYHYDPNCERRNGSVARWERRARGNQ